MGSEMCIRDRSTCLRVEPGEFDEAAPGELHAELGPGVFSADLMLNMKIVNGWRCSYRLNPPETLSGADCKPKLRRKLNGLAGYVAAIPEVGRRPPQAQRLFQVRMTADKRKEIAKRVSALRREQQADEAAAAAP